jgi:O-antigen/teichoic acid export membrane protein
MEMDYFYRAAGTILAPFRYAQREIKEAKEDLKDEAQQALSTTLKLAAMGIFALFFLAFLSITAAMAINDSMDSPWVGFAIVAGFFFVVAIGIYAWYKASSKKHEEYKERKAHARTVPST